MAAQLQSAAAQLAPISVSSNLRELQWCDIQLNLPGHGNSAHPPFSFPGQSAAAVTLGVDAVRFTVPSNAPPALVWRVFIPQRVLECGLLPVTGQWTDRKERIVYFQQTWQHPDSVQYTSAVHVGRTIESPAIQPGREFIIWFAFEHLAYRLYQRPDEVSQGKPAGQYEEAPVVRLCLQAVPPETLRAECWVWQGRNGPYANIPFPKRTHLLLHGGGVGRIAISPDGSMLATVGDSGPVKLWNVATETVVATCPGRLAEFSPNGKILATNGSGDDATSVIFWDAKTGSKLRALKPDHFMAVSAIAFSPDGKRLATGGQDGMVSFLDTEPLTGSASPDTKSARESKRP